jgi:hypothetical protein
MAHNGRPQNADTLAAEIAAQAGAIGDHLTALQEAAESAPVLRRAELAVELRKVAARAERLAKLAARRP